MDAISGKNVLVAAPSLREIEHVTPVHHPLLVASRQAAHSRATSGEGTRRGGMRGHSRGFSGAPNAERSSAWPRGSVPAAVSRQQHRSQHRLRKAAAFSRCEIPKDEEKLADNMED